MQGPEGRDGATGTVQPEWLCGGGHCCRKMLPCHVLTVATFFAGPAGAALAAGGLPALAGATETSACHTKLFRLHSQGCTRTSLLERAHTCWGRAGPASPAAASAGACCLEASEPSSAADCSTMGVRAPSGTSSDKGACTGPEAELHGSLAEHSPLSDPAL